MRLIIMMLAVVLVPGVALAQEKPAPPAGEKLEDIQKDIRREYRTESRKARTPEAKFVLAGMLLEKLEPAGDADKQFAMLLAAKDLYQESGFHDRAFVTVDRIAEWFAVDPISLKRETLEDAAKSRTLNPLSCYMLAIETRKILIELMAANQNAKAREIAGLMEDAAKKTGNRGLAEKFENLDTAIKELEGPEKVKGERVVLGQARLVLGRDKHLASAGIKNVDTEYFIKLKSTRKADGLRVWFNGKRTGDGTNEGKISVTFNGENWFDVSEWTTRDCQRAEAFGNWQEFVLSGPELLMIDRLGVRLNYTKGAVRYEIEEVSIVE